MLFAVTERRGLYRGLFRDVNVAPGAAMLAAYPWRLSVRR
jgi:hypothetical protein